MNMSYQGILEQIYRASNSFMNPKYFRELGTSTTTYIEEFNFFALFSFLVLQRKRGRPGSKSVNSDKDVNSVPKVSPTRYNPI